MKQYLLLHYGLETPTEEIMKAGGEWFDSISDREVARGGFAAGREVSRAGTRELPWAADSITGYNIIEADSLDEEEEVAARCPFIAGIRVYELREP